jgi:GNAT superfamily N-acetyltransferase
MPHHLAVAAIVDGGEPGEVYAEHGQRPDAAVLFGSNQHRVYLAGAPDGARFGAGVADLLATRRGGRTPFGFVVYHDGRSEQTAARLAPDAALASAERRFLRLGPAGFATPRPVSGGFDVRPIDQALLATGLRHTDELIEEIRSESPSVDDFLARKFGYCALAGDTIVGFCCSEYNHAGRCELGVTTLAPYRRRGVATAVVTATVEEAFRRGVSEIGWHCWANNAASLALAARLGFEHVRDYPVRVCHWPR